MAVLKHIVSKNANYGESLDYLLFQHDERTKKPILNEHGQMILREEYYLDGLNCEPMLFDKECERLNDQYHKNQTYDEIKSHHYIISFDPADRDECGLTGEKAQELGLEYARKNFPGHQALVCFYLRSDSSRSSGSTEISIASFNIGIIYFRSLLIENVVSSGSAIGSSTATYSSKEKSQLSICTRIKRV